ncbi:hypothetical protein N7468_008249 [Penicillium chermesinum]|uniref:Uncharacterized protein n=1 Tax=Penicillium chermesinum TaxID=63820 RepID=A0A9W9NPF2_9EURO|nr:uncharacterized protein N7468_008249 [Penicillium chermesinum]KAJ5223707.1 hypothetical protein N7468_008249 [Penicillium chermesinum]KAJ6155466.1 hypothetical protein N7470_006032 [Penicillium chermesinum]
MSGIIAVMPVGHNNPLPPRTSLPAFHPTDIQKPKTLSAMTERSQIQQQTDVFHSQDSGAGPPLSGVHNSRSDPHNSIEGYNRTMLEYTQRQMSSFVDLDEANANGGGASSRSSQSSGNSGTSGSGVLAGSANGPSTTAPASADARQAQQMSSRESNGRSF